MTSLPETEKRSIQQEYKEILKNTREVYNKLINIQLDNKNFRLYSTSSNFMYDALSKIMMGGVEQFNDEKIVQIAKLIVDSLESIPKQVSEEIWNSMNEIFDELVRIFYTHFQYEYGSHHDEIDNLEAKLERIRDFKKAQSEEDTSSESEDSKTEDKTPGEAHVENKPGFFRKIWNGLFGSRKIHEETKKLLMDLKALEMSMDEE